MAIAAACRSPGCRGRPVLIFWLVVALLAPWIAPYPPGRVVDPDVLGPMTWAFPLGTDYLGRDMLSRVLFGARITLGIALAATALACLTGSHSRLLAAVRGGWLDTVLSRVLDASSRSPA